MAGWTSVLACKPQWCAGWVRVGVGVGWGTRQHTTENAFRASDVFIPLPSHTLLWPVNTLWIDRSLPSCFWCCCWPLVVVDLLLLFFVCCYIMHQGLPSVLGTPSLSRPMLTSIILFTRLWANWPRSTQTKRTSIPVLYKQQSNTLHAVHCVYHYGKARFLASRFLHSNNTQHAQKLQCGPMLMSVHFSPFPVPWIWFMLQHVHWPQSSKRKRKTRLNPCSVSQHLEWHQRILDFVMHTQ